MITGQDLYSAFNGCDAKTDMIREFRHALSNSGLNADLWCPQLGGGMSHLQMAMAVLLSHHLANELMDQNSQVQLAQLLEAAMSRWNMLSHASRTQITITDQIISYGMT